MQSQIPPPIRTDGSNEFAHKSMVERVPSIIEEVMERNPDYPSVVIEDLQALNRSIRDNERMELFDGPAPDYDCWARRFSPHEGESWLDTEWFFSEMLAYRRVVAASRYWTTRRDPFGPFKEEEIQSEALSTVVEDALQRDEDREVELGQRLKSSLWGNRMDLSMKWVLEQGTTAKDEHLLRDDVPAVVRGLLSGPSGPIHILMDNAGTEEAFDLALTDTLLSKGVATTVTLHVKMTPVLVGDVIGEDILRLLDVMESHGGALQELARRIRQYIRQDRLHIVPDFFWNTDGRMWELPPRLQKAFRRARLVIAKGDVNYRRITNDALWPVDTEISDPLADFPAPLLALRTIKSDTVMGVDPETVARLDQEEEGWRTEGTYGVAQFAE